MSPATLPSDLQRVVGATQLFTIGFGCIVGFGWIILMGQWLNQAGPIGTILAFAAGALVMVLVGCCYGELSAMMPVSGGEMAYAYQVFGLRTAFVVGWAIVLFTIVVISYVAVSSAWLLETLWPAARGPALYSFRGTSVNLGSILTALIVVLTLGAMNYRGVRVATGFQDAFTWAKLALAGTFIGLGVAYGRAENLEPWFQQGAGDTAWSGVVAVFITTPWFYGGFNSIPQVLEETSPRTSKVAVVKVMLLSIAAAATFYCLAVLAVSMVQPWPALVTMDLPTASAFREAFHSDTVANLVLLAGLLGTFTVGNAIYLWGTRLLFAMSRGRLLPAPLALIHPTFGSPAKATALLGTAAALAVPLGREMIVPIVNVGGNCLALGYLVTCLAVIRLRRHDRTAPRPYRVPGGVVTAGLGALATLSMLISSVYQPFTTRTGVVPLEWVVMVAWTALGWGLWRLGSKRRASIGEAERRRAVLGDAGQTAPTPRAQHAPLTGTVSALAALVMTSTMACSPADATSHTTQAIRTPDPPVAATLDSSHPYLFASSSGGLLLSWIEQMPHERALRFALLNNAVWSEPRTIVTGADLGGHPSAILLADGTIAAHWQVALKNAANPAAYDLFLSRSLDNGLTWSTPVRPYRGDAQVYRSEGSLAPTGPNAFVFAWLDERARAYVPPSAGEARGQYIGRSMLMAAPMDATGRLGPELTLDNDVCACCHTSMSRTDDGVVVVYRDRSEANVRDINLIELAHGRASTPRTVHDDHWVINACPVNGPAVSSIGTRVVTAWFTVVNDTGHVRAAFSDDLGRQFGTAVEIADAVPFGWVDAILLDDGSALVSWIERTTPGGALKVRRVARDGRRGSSLVVARSSSPSRLGYPRMERHQQDVVLAWTDADAKRVRLARVGLAQFGLDDPHAPSRP